MARSSFRLLFAGLAVAALLQGCDIKVDDGKVSLGVSRGRASDEWVRSYTLAKGGRFEIANENGQIDVRGTQGSEVKVKAFREVSSNSDEDAQQRLKNLKMREDVSSDRVFIQAQTGETEHLGFGSGLGVRYEVEVPAGLTVTVKTMNGAVRLDDVDGKITAATTNGNVSGDAVSGEVQGSTVNGSVSLTLEAVSGDVRLTTVNGAIRLEVPPTVNADLDAATVNGGVSVDDKLGLAEVSRDRGSFGPATSIRGRLNKGGPRLTLQTTNGGVRVSAPGGGGDDERRPGRRGRRGRGEPR
ncbi:MAG TPA: DUF4097 family beta strand repeat-containing protein [Vicinamibacterales bacterium]|jgi:hypothetical protein|nr:DUF4097 family beta strand repeat-containing protein [Vicinamibacterales bacterium]